MLSSLTTPRHIPGPPRASLYIDLLANSAAHATRLRLAARLCFAASKMTLGRESSAYWALGTPPGQSWPHPSTPGSPFLEALLPTRAWHVSLAQHGGVDSVHMWWLGRCGDALPCAQPRVSHRFRTSQHQDGRGAPRRGVGIFSIYPCRVTASPAYVYCPLVGAAWHRGRQAHRGPASGGGREIYCPAT